MRAICLTSVCALMLCFAMAPQPSLAETPSASRLEPASESGPSATILHKREPKFSNGIIMGDVLERAFEVEVPANTQLTKTSLPLKGTTRNGIELRDSQVETSTHGDTTTYHIALRYQVFASAPRPVVMALPDEHITLKQGEKALTIAIPAWKFWYAPLVAEGITNAKENMQPQMPAALLDVQAHQIRLWIALGLLSVGLVGLLYVNADLRWLPFMNGVFAQAHRRIKRLTHVPSSSKPSSSKPSSSKPLSSKQAFMHLHQAFNQLHGENLFASNLDAFFQAQPKFLTMRDDITQFFAQSNQVLFASHQAQPTQEAQTQEAKNLAYLLAFSKQLRDCERGVA